MPPSDATGTLDFATPLLCQQLWNGDHLAFPSPRPPCLELAAVIIHLLQEPWAFVPAVEEDVAQGQAGQAHGPGV